MTRIILYASTLGLLIYSSVLSGDLYLLDIHSNDALVRVTNTIDHAHGVLGDKFIVDISEDQYRSLLRADVTLELLVRNCRLENLYLLVEDHRRVPKTAISLTPLYSTPKSKLVELEKSSVSILERAGYMVFPLVEKITPFFYRGPFFPGPSAYDYPTDSIAALISLDSLYSYNTRLEDFYTRFTITDSCIAARNWIRNKFLSFGYTDVHFQNFLATREWMNVLNAPAYNVICRKEGTVKPDRWIIIGAHYDSYASGGSTDPYVPAPGADDNASGMAAILELARVFKDIEFAKSLMFVAFGAEEQGLYGSYYLAEQLYEESLDIEYMNNFDVIAYENDAIPDFWLSSTQGWAYGQVYIDAAARLNDLIPMKDSYPISSDDRSFYDLGYYTVTPYEAYFHPDMHTDGDVSSSIDFGYMKKIVEMAAAAIPVIDLAGEPTVCRLYDVGDGQALRAVWESCYDDYSYRVVYGPRPYLSLDTIAVAPLTCFSDISGLTEGVVCSVAVIGIPGDGYPPVSLKFSAEAPLSLPRTPAGFTIMPDSASIVLDWYPNIELDLSHYKLLRKGVDDVWQVLESSLVDTHYVDLNVESGQAYTYSLLAVDNDQNESDSSENVSCVPATFDHGILFVDETQADGNNPPETEQLLFYGSMFGDVDFTLHPLNDEDRSLTRCLAGQYNSIFWVDDDDTTYLLGGSLDTLAWYFGYDTDFLLAGWQTIHSITGQSYFYPGSFFYDNLGISYIGQNSLPDFRGAIGLNGWPDLVLNNEKNSYGFLPYIDIFTAAPNAEVIYGFNSASSHPYYSNKPVGVAFDTHYGKRVVLGFPLYYLTEASAQALVAKVLEYFAEETVLYGDVNGDWSVNLLDITYLINYLYKEGSPPPDMNNADVNGNCTINILDATYLINYLYKGGPAPVEGCVN